MTWGVTHEVLGASMLLSSTEQNPFYAPPENGNRVFPLKMFSSPHGPGEGR